MKPRRVARPAVSAVARAIDPAARGDPDVSGIRGVEVPGVDGRVENHALGDPAPGGAAVARAEGLPPRAGVEDAPVARIEGERLDLLEARDALSRLRPGLAAVRRQTHAVVAGHREQARLSRRQGERARGDGAGRLREDGPVPRRGRRCARRARRRARPPARPTAGREPPDPQSERSRRSPGTRVPAEAAPRSRPRPSSRRSFRGRCRSRPFRRRTGSTAKARTSAPHTGSRHHDAARRVRSREQGQGEQTGGSGQGLHAVELYCTGCGPARSAKLPGECRWPRSASPSFPRRDWGPASCRPPRPSPRRCCRWSTGPLVQYVVEEARDAGIERIVIVTGRGKNAIEDHFDTSFELERMLEDRGKSDLLEQVREVSELIPVSYVRQKQALGLGPRRPAGARSRGRPAVRRHARRRHRGCRRSRASGR